MFRYRPLLLVVALLLVVGAVTGSSGPSSMEANRDMGLTITDDDAANLGFEQTTETTNETTNLSVWLTNQFSSDVTLQTVTVTIDGESAELGPLSPGENARADFHDVDCGSSITVEASGSDVEARLDRNVDCGE